MNFTDEDQRVYCVPRKGLCTELLRGLDNVQALANESRTLLVPSNYGGIWTI